MTVNEKPKPCPFCGAMPELRLWPGKLFKVWSLRCTNGYCMCKVEVATMPCRTRKKAIEFWNHRAPCGRRVV